MSDTPVNHPPEKRFTFYAMIPHPYETQVLLVPGAEGAWTLPYFHPTEHFTYRTGPLNSAMRELLGADVTVLRCAYAKLNHAEKHVDAIFEMENHNPAWSPVGDARWVGRADLPLLDAVPEAQRATIEEWLREQESGEFPPGRQPWSRRGWLDRVEEWAGAQLALHGLGLEGRPEQYKVWGISCVLRLRTSGGVFYFKSVPAIFAQEPGITLGIAHMYPGYAPAPAAIMQTLEEGWMLLPEFSGEPLLHPTVTQLEDILRLHARVQADAAGQVSSLFRVGCIDRRLNRLAEQVEEILADDEALEGLEAEEKAQVCALAPSLKALCAELASYNVPQTLVHGDLYAGNTFPNGDSYTLFDWTDGCVSHPFFDLVTFMDSGETELTTDDEQRLVGAYLEAWAAYETKERLEDAYRLSKVLGALHHAISYRNILRSVESTSVRDIEGSMRYFLRMLLAAHSEWSRESRAAAAGAHSAG